MGDNKQKDRIRNERAPAPTNSKKPSDQQFQEMSQHAIFIQHPWCCEHQSGAVQKKTEIAILNQPWYLMNVQISSIKIIIRIFFDTS